VFAVYGLVAVSNVIGITSILLSIVHTIVLCTVACFTASPLAVWIISVLFLLSFNLSFTRDLMVGDIFADFIVKTVLPHFAQSHLLTLTPPLSLTLIPTPTPNPLTLTHWAKWDWAKMGGHR